MSNLHINDKTYFRKNFLSPNYLLWFFYFFSALFSLIGIAASIRWATSSTQPPQLNDIPNNGCSSSATDGCPWQHVISDLANRLQLLEMAFKEQVVARETIIKEVSNQSDVNSSLEKKLTIFLQRLSQLDSHIHSLEVRLEELTNRLHSDGRQV